MADLEKIDMGLFMALRAYEENPHKNPDDGISISLRFEGDLQSIEALGFDTHMVMGDTALGEVKFKDVETIAAHPGVLWMSAGERPRAYLDTAVSDIKARATAPVTAPPPVDGLWHVDKTTGVLTNIPDGTGKDVIVAIIDTGIDYKHPMFMSDLGPPKKTRILSIWDQGLRPTVSRAQCPDVALLASKETYGIEYDSKKIEDDLNGVAAIAHKDCIGHGTHVAGIAAGGPKFFPSADASCVGVAPEATIIAVKLLDNPDPINYRLVGGFGAVVGADMLFKDAVFYCLRKAKLAGKPVVINMSFGNNAEPGDGLDEGAEFMDKVMDPGHAEGPENFPKRAIIVKAAGNDGDPVDHQTARIVIPGAVGDPIAEVIVPFELKDTRGGLKTRWQRCLQRDFLPPIGVDFWYRRASPFDSVNFALRLPFQPAFSGDMPVGGNLFQGFVLKVGPPPSIAFVVPTTSVYTAFVRHMGNAAVKDPRGGPDIRRHRVVFRVDAKTSVGSIDYPVGVYEMRIKAPPTTEIFAMCDRQHWARAKEVTFEVRDKRADGTPIDPAIIQINNSFSAVDTGGKHVITVAAYDDKDGVAGPDKGEIAEFSSRGPLRDFSNGAAGPIAVKPDIAAPGVKIKSAQGIDTEVLVRGLHFLDGDRYIEFRGTSMAAPMVAGVVALMLDKNPDLNTDDVRSHLIAAARAAVKPSASPGKEEAYGNGMIDALESYKLA